jgi:hypothetical protein
MPSSLASNFLETAVISLVIIILAGCQKTSPVSPHCKEISQIDRSSDQEELLSPESLCLPISINAIRGGPPIQCCPNVQKLASNCPPCPFGVNKWKDVNLDLELKILGVAVCGIDILIFPWSVDFGWRVYLPEGRITPDLRRQESWLQSVYREDKVLNVVYTTRRCIRREHNKIDCSQWGEEEEFEQGFLCE